MNFKVSTNQVNSTTGKYYTKLLWRELLEFLGIWILLLMEYSSLHSSYVTNFHKLKKKFQFSMGINRFKAIHSSLGFTVSSLKLLSSELCSSFQKHWTPGSIVAFDESIYSYQPQKKTKLASRTTRNVIGLQAVFPAFPDPQ